MLHMIYYDIQLITSKLVITDANFDLKYSFTTMSIKFHLHLINVANTELCLISVTHDKNTTNIACLCLFMEILILSYKVPE